MQTAVRILVQISSPEAGVRQQWAGNSRLDLFAICQACEMAVLGKNVVTRHQEEWQEGEGAMQDLVLAQLRVAGVDEAGFAWGAECEATRPQ